ncbi:hypothetical protein BU23DRAFT_574153 [Bimuria novae-zelandiae CBS 107.79]|uniref:Uncharacterized protein n=1 Tax=Bimuria novae-zelandiae CBS 107.79 TaxID=1447943 RepID=A0A6A5UNP8_9PLEO|nr:hypothetical protein BU23DRAFT_574153 [Bimuria novae-zelandiae CBS 107.79]
MVMQELTVTNDTPVIAVFSFDGNPLHHSTAGPPTHPLHQHHSFTTPHHRLGYFTPFPIGNIIDSDLRSALLSYEYHTGNHSIPRSHVQKGVLRYYNMAVRVIYHARNAKELIREGERPKETLEFPKHDPDEPIDINNFPHREVMGPSFDFFDPYYLNFGTMSLMNVKHHDSISGEARTRASFLKAPWPATYYPCLEYVTLSDGRRVRCSYTFRVFSSGCWCHPFAQGYNSIFRKAQHNPDQLIWRDLMDPIDILVHDYEKAKKERMENATEKACITFQEGDDMQEILKAINDNEQAFKDALEMRIDEIKEKGRLRPQQTVTFNKKQAKGKKNNGRRSTIAGPP